MYNAVGFAVRNESKNRTLERETFFSSALSTKLQPTTEAMLEENVTQCDMRVELLLVTLIISRP